VVRAAVSRGICVIVIIRQDYMGGKIKRKAPCCKNRKRPIVVLNIKIIECNGVFRYGFDIDSQMIIELTEV